MVVTKGTLLTSKTFLAKQHREVATTSLYNEENAAIRTTLEWLLQTLEAVAIKTDRQSLRKAIQSVEADTLGLRRMLNKRADTTTLLWIPGHHGIAGDM